MEFHLWSSIVCGLLAKRGVAFEKQHAKWTTQIHAEGPAPLNLNVPPSVRCCHGACHAPCHAACHALAVGVSGGSR